nr:SURF1 family protein [Azospirillum rugosum]
MLLIGLLTLAGVAGLTALGVWQLERRVWKLALIDRVEERVHAAPVPAPSPATWPAVSTEGDEYRRVQARGTFLNDRETLVQAVTNLGGGFWVLTPFRTTEGFTVLVNRGFVPPDKRDPASRAEGQTAGETTVTGLLRMTEPKGGFLRSNDPAGDRWYSRDVAAIAAARGLSDTAPYFIDADGTPNPGGFPVGGLTVISFPNNHLQYALTWFALAIMTAGAGAFVLRHDLRQGKTQRSAQRQSP